MSKLHYTRNHPSKQEVTIYWEILEDTEAIGEIAFMVQIYDREIEPVLSTNYFQKVAEIFNRSTETYFSPNKTKKAPTM